MLVKDLLPGDLARWSSLRNEDQEEFLVPIVDDCRFLLVIDIWPATIEHHEYGSSRPGHTLTLQASRSTDGTSQTWWEDTDHLNCTPIVQVVRAGKIIYSAKSTNAGGVYLFQD